MSPEAGRHAIPRTFHWLWLGSSEVPPVFGYYIDRWRDLHPEWQWHVWREATLPPLSCQAAFERCSSFKERYDIVRLEIVRQFGGIILDMDMEPVRSIEPLLAGISAFAGRLGRRHVGNQILGAVPGHPFFEDAVRVIRDRAGDAKSSSAGAGKQFLKAMLDAHPDVTLFPPSTFYYQPSFDPPRNPGAFPDVYAVHHELSSYAALVPPFEVGRRVRALAGIARTALQEHLPAGTDDATALLARLTKAERRLHKLLAASHRGHRARMRTLEAEREQADGRHRREVQHFEQVIRDLRSQLDDARTRIESLERKAEGGQLSRLRRLFDK